LYRKADKQASAFAFALVRFPDAKGTMGPSAKLFIGASFDARQKLLSALSTLLS
jgi:hypothetical protein